MSYHGDIRLGDTIDIQFTTVNGAGLPTTLDDTPAVAAYVGNSGAEITAGITLSVDHDSRTGLNNVRVVASSGNGFATQTNVSLVVTAGEVGGISIVGYQVGSFSIENRSALMPTVPTRTADVTETGALGIDWGNVENKTTVNDFTQTTISPSQVVASVTGAVASVTGAVGSVTGGVGGNVAGNVGGNVVGSVGSVTAPVTVGTNTDKTGYAIGVGGITAMSFAAGAIDAAALNATAVTEIVVGVFARAYSAAYGSFTFEQITEIIVSACAGVASGLETTNAKYRNLNNSADVIDATVDANGNRTAVTLTP